LEGKISKTMNGFNWETTVKKVLMNSFKVLDWTPEIKSGEVFKLSLETSKNLTSVYLVDPKNTQIKAQRKGEEGLWEIEFPTDENLAPGIQNFVLYTLNEDGQTTQTTIPVKVSVPEREQFNVKETQLPEAFVRPESLDIRVGDQRLSPESDYEYNAALRKITFKNIS
jgi:hypothetical protein